MQKSDDIYALLVTMSEDIGHAKGTVEQILVEAKKTNGRVTKLEEKLSANETQNKISWAKVGWVGGLGLFLLVAAFNLFLDWIKSQFIK